MLAVITVLALIGVALALFAAAALSTRDGGVLADAPPDAADIGLPEGVLMPEDVAGVRFAMAPRGYRMAEVDEVLERCAAELADRDRRLALLEVVEVVPAEPLPAEPLPAQPPLPAGPARAEPLPAQSPLPADPLPADPAREDLR